MNLKDTQLDAEALFSQVVFGHGFAHYGYWPEGEPDVPSLRALGEAQQAYFDLLAATIPDGVKTILDVGSGTGSNALALTKLGYELECLCPSEQLNQMARTKLGDGVDVHTLKFEDYETDKRFDMCLFAESFHYIELEEALKRAARYATGYVLMFDYFRRASGDYDDDTRGTHAEFLAKIEKLGDFEIVSDDDKTAAILPTFFVTDFIKNTHVAPFVGRFEAELRQNHPVYNFFIQRFLGRAIRKVQRRSKRHETFGARHEYRLILLKKKN